MLLADGCSDSLEADGSLCFLLVDGSPCSLAVEDGLSQNQVLCEPRCNQRDRDLRSRQPVLSSKIPGAQLTVIPDCQAEWVP